MGSGSKSKSRSVTVGNETTTPTYQSYAGKIIKGLYPQMQDLWSKSIAGYGESGYNPLQTAIWGDVLSKAGADWGLEGPYAAAANQYIQPYLGEGYMQQLQPYFNKRESLIQSALPQEKAAYLQQLKNEFGPAWGTSGRALGAAGESYANWQAAKARDLANVEAEKIQAAQQGMNYSMGGAQTYANMVNPFTWGQQGITWAGAPEQATSEAMRQQQQLALGWSNPLMAMAQMGYQYPVSTTTGGTQATAGKATAFQGGMNCCFIMNEAGDLTEAVRRARDGRYKNDREVAIGYIKMAKWLVPIMQRNQFVKFLVKYTMTRPIAKVAEVRMADKHCPALYPIGLFWEAVWRIYGLLPEHRKDPSYIIKRLARFYRI